MVPLLREGHSPGLDPTFLLQCPWPHKEGEGLTFPACPFRPLWPALGKTINFFDFRADFDLLVTRWVGVGQGISVPLLSCFRHFQWPWGHLPELSAKKRSLLSPLWAPKTALPHLPMRVPKGTQRNCGVMWGTEFVTGDLS